jgi:hypothetical protein
MIQETISNMSECFKRWKDINSIEKYREGANNQINESLLKVLNGLLITIERLSNPISH